MLNVNIYGADELSKKLENLVQTQGNLPRVLEVFAQKIFDSIVSGAERHSKSGNLVRSLGTGPKAIERGYEIGHDLQFAHHALFLHWGTRPHEIRPKDKKSLRWTNGGQFVFAKLIRHPGYKGDPYMTDALSNTLKDFDGIVKTYLLKD